MAAVGSNWALMQSSLKRKRAAEPGQTKTSKRRKHEASKDGSNKEALESSKEKKKKRKRKREEGPGTKSHASEMAPKRASKKGEKRKRMKGRQDSRSTVHVPSMQSHAEKQEAAGTTEVHALAAIARPKQPTAAMRARNVRPAPFVLKSHSGLPRSERVVRPGEEFYEELLTGPYKGFVVEEPPPEGSENFSWVQRAENAFAELSDMGYFKYDVVQPGRVEDQAATFVRRCVVGDRGATYKYLGLRVFAYPWDGDGLPAAIKEMGNLNNRMVAMTSRQLDRYHDSCDTRDRGSCQYNLTLINEMPPIKAPDGKEAPFPGSGRAVVSWHQDTSLEDYSSVAVFHVVQGAKQGGMPWSVAVRVIYDKKTAALQVPLPTGTTYYMLDTFNRHHQHVVIAGDGLRYSSTHRVAKTSRATWEHIFTIATEAVSLVRHISSPITLSSAQIGSIQAAHTEIEDEWLRQWFWQGEAHASRQKYWKQCIEGELLCLWKELEGHCKELVEELIVPGHPTSSTVLATALQKRQDSRTLWERKLDIFKTSSISAKLPKEDQPVPSPLFPFEGKTLGKDLEPTIKRLLHK